jgi:hypothetical protein
MRYAGGISKTRGESDTVGPTIGQDFWGDTHCLTLDFFSKRRLTVCGYEDGTPNAKSNTGPFVAAENGETNEKIR